MRHLHSLLVAFLVLAAVACHEKPSAVLCQTVDSLNTLAYSWHYKNVDSLRIFAEEAYRLSLNSQYADGQAEALNNMAFERFQQMDFDSALVVAGRVAANTKNLSERLIANVTLMKVAQRTSDNRSFFLHRAAARNVLNILPNESRK